MLVKAAAFGTDSIELHDRIEGAVMKPKTIVVHLDDSASGERRLDIAVRIARRFESRLKAVYPAWRNRIEVDIAEFSPREVGQLMSEREARERAESLLRRMATQAALAEVEVCVLQGDPIEQALAEMRCADLSILSQPDEGSDASGFDRQFLENAVLGAGGPIMILPRVSSTLGIGDNVVIAWDGSREAARAVRDAMPFLASASHTTLLSLGDRCRLNEDVGRSQARVVRFLATHGVQAKTRSMASTLNDPGEVLLSQLCDLGADLLVMGAYGHPRIRELILGGVTQTMLEKMTVPLLMSH